MYYKANQCSRRSSDTSDTLTNFLTSTSSRSSNASDWTFAADAIRQNQQDWEQIERIFYSEEPLPTDEKTKEEFQDWMETFPYLRLVGKNLKTNCFRKDGKPNFREELIAEDPTSCVQSSRRAGDLNRDCKAVRSSLMARRRSGQVCHGEVRAPDGSAMTFREAEVKLHNQNAFPPRPGALTSNSGSWFRLPTITPIKSSKWPSSGNSVQKGVRPSPLTSTITLPLINVDKLLTFGDLLTTRSISALHNNHPGGSRNTEAVTRRLN